MSCAYDQEITKVIALICGSAHEIQEQSRNHAVSALGSKVPSMHSRFCPQLLKYRGADATRLIGLWLEFIKYYAHVQALCTLDFSSAQCAVCVNQDIDYLQIPRLRKSNKRKQEMVRG